MQYHDMLEKGCLLSALRGAVHSERERINHLTQPDLNGGRRRGLEFRV